MMNYKEFRELAITKLQELYKKETLSQDFMFRFKKEIEKAEYYYLDGVDLYEKFKTTDIVSGYTLPYVLGFTDSYDLERKLEVIQIVKGASGGIDIDSDFESAGRETIINYLKEKYGEDCVFPVGTISMLGLKSATKDLLKYYGASYAESNEFTGALDNDLTFQENVDSFQVSNKKLYQFYLRNKKILDLTPKFFNKARNMGKHAGGICILPKPIYNYIPVERSSDTLVTAFQESGQVATLDSLGIIKLDLLGITVLDNIKEAVNLIDEELYLIEEDGIEKIVPKSYLEEKGVAV